MRRLARRTARLPLALAYRTLGRARTPRDEEGAILVEYSMLLLLIVVVAIAAVDQIGRIVESLHRLGAAMFS